MKMKSNMFYATMILALTLASCGQKSNSTETAADDKPAVQFNAPQFNADSAYYFTDAQVKFGPRVPNTKAHDDCAKYLEEQLSRFGAKLYMQDCILKAYDGTKLKSVNIIGSYNPDSKDRVLLCAHWDSRPFADHDPDTTNYHKPILAADDGASGVAVLLEIARQISIKAHTIGVDIIFFDSEDYGVPDFETKSYSGDSWCLGTQFWAKHPHVPNYTAKYGILLDMVGARNATFYREEMSVQKAAPIVETVWSKAQDLGYNSYFVNTAGGAITDDHLYVMSGRKIPCIDIINLDPSSQTGFAAHWHTVSDDMGNIDRATLKAVGQTVMEVIYSEK